MEQRDIDEIIDGLFSVLPVFRKKVQRIGDEILKDQEISRAHFQIMKQLRRSGPCTMTELGKMLSVSKPNITKLVDKLFELDFIKRKSDDNDRRLTYIALTEQGQDYAEKILGIMKATLSNNMQKFTEDDLTLFKDTMNNMKTLIHRMTEEE